MKNFLTQQVHTILGTLLLGSVALWAGMSITSVAQSADAGTFDHLRIIDSIEE